MDSLEQLWSTFGSVGQNRTFGAASGPVWSGALELGNWFERPAGSHPVCVARTVADSIHMSVYMYVLGSDIETRQGDVGWAVKLEGEGERANQWCQIVEDWSFERGRGVTVSPSYWLPACSFTPWENHVLSYRLQITDYRLMIEDSVTLVPLHCFLHSSPQSEN